MELISCKFDQNKLFHQVLSIYIFFNHRLKKVTLSQECITRLYWYEILLSVKEKWKYWGELCFLFNTKCGWANLKIMEQIIYITRKCIIDWYPSTPCTHSTYWSSLRHSTEIWQATTCQNCICQSSQVSRETWQLSPLLARIMRYGPCVISSYWQDTIYGATFHWR